MEDILQNFDWVEFISIWENDEPNSIGLRGFIILAGIYLGVKMISMISSKYSRRGEKKDDV